MNNLWTNDDILNLKNCYEMGDTLKQMALKTNRTATAVNKALTRFGIRGRTAQKGSAYRFLRKEFEEADDRRIIKNSYIYAKRKPQVLRKIESLSQKLIAFHKEYIQSSSMESKAWQSIKDVVDYLRTQKKMVFIVKARGAVKEDVYYIDQKEISAKELLKIANQYRELENKYPLCLKGVSL